MNTPEQDWQARAMSYSAADDEPEPEDEFQELLQRTWERQEAKKKLLAGLLALRVVGRSLVRER